jgi:hypothetical protein
MHFYEINSNDIAEISKQKYYYLCGRFKKDSPPDFFIHKIEFL